MLNSHHLLHFNIAFQLKIITLKKKNLLTFRCNSMMKDLWIEKQTAKGNIGIWEFLNFILWVYFTFQQQTVSCFNNWKLFGCEIELLVSLSSIRSSIINLVIVLIVSCQIDIEKHGLDVFSLQLLKQTGSLPMGATPPTPPPLLSLSYPLNVMYFLSSWSKHVLADYCIAIGSSICSRKLVTVTKNQDNFSSWSLKSK